MSDGRKNNSKYSTALFLCGLFILITGNISGNDVSSEKFYKALTEYRDTVVSKVPFTDTLPAKTDTLPTDSLIKTIDTISVKISKDSLDQPINYSASDSIVFIIPSKKIILYSQGSVKKGDMDLSADSIEIDQSTQMLTATFRKDTSGKIIGKPKMIQGGSTMEADVIKYNTKTQRGITQHTITQQGEIYIQGEKIKKVSVRDFYAYRSQFTTCNLDTPHFAFLAKRMKLINQKLAVSGPIHPEFEGVPIPLYLPFGIFPISQGRHSGFLPPQFTASEQFGLGLQNMGYYKVINDNVDVTVRSDIYTYGGWALYLSPEYRRRYRYNGRLNFTMQRTRLLGNDPKQDFTDTKTFNINWSHTVDSKARPGTNFTANVNAGSTKFNRLVLNNPTRNYNNQMNSSITYSKTWDTRYNLTVSANHNQNNNSGVITLNLPTVAFTASTVYPFQKKEYAGTPKWYEKLGIGLNTNLANQINFYDSLFSFRNLVDTLQWGAQHTIPIQLSLPSLGPVQISPGISYGEKWFSRQFQRVWDPIGKDVDTVIKKGFFTQRDISFSVSLSTALFGKFDKFGKSSSVKAIRHVIRPTASVSYKPDLTAKDFYRTQVDTNANRSQRFSYYDGAIFSPFSGGTFGGISFGIDNNIEMKVKPKKDTGDAPLKKVRLLDGFGFNGAYNLMADSFRLSPISVYIRSTLFEKINVTASGTLDPYQNDKFGDRVDRYVWSSGKFSPGKLTNASLAISTSFKSKPKDEKKEQEQQELEEGLAPLTMDEQMNELEYARQNPSEFADFNIPWNVNVSYSLNYYRQLNRDYTYSSQINSTASINGDFNLTPRWKMGMNSFYDFKTSKIQMLTMYISREMHCWQLSINVTPVGIVRSFNITVSPKSSILRDLRINRTRSFYGQ